MPGIRELALFIRFNSTYIVCKLFIYKQIPLFLKKINFLLYKKTNFVNLQTRPIKLLLCKKKVFLYLKRIDKNMFILKRIVLR